MLITGRGNRQVHAAQPRRGQTPRRGVFFVEVGRVFLPARFLFFSVIAEKSKRLFCGVASRVESINGRKKENTARKVARAREPEKGAEGLLSSKG